MIIPYLKHLWQRGTAHGLHSPFVFDFFNQILKNDPILSEFNSIEKLRKSLKKNYNSLQIEDFGAGSKIFKNNWRTVAQIAKSAEKKPKYARLIYRIIEKYKPKHIIDLGTSLGLTSAYMAIANSNAQILSFEGCKNIATLAQNNFNELNTKNIRLITGNIDHTLRPALDNLTRVDLVFFDANHRFEPTKDYFEICLTKAHEDSIFIFDDIYWSEEMEKAWLFIKNHEKVSISIDVFQFGIVFFRSKQPKQHFVLKY